MSFQSFYIILSAAVAAIDLIVGLKASLRKCREGTWLSVTCFAAAIVDLSYLLAILTEDYTTYSVLSSVYFMSIDVMLLAFAQHVQYVTLQEKTPLLQALSMAFPIYGVLDIAFLAINPFREISIHYIFRDTPIAMYSYDMKALYVIHLIFCYVLIAVIIGMIVYKIINSPREYAMRYWIVIIGISVIVGVNGIYLFLPGVTVYNLIDYSIIGYSIAIMFAYYGCFEYSEKTLAGRFKQHVFDSIDQGIVMFDTEDRMMISNAKIRKLLPSVSFVTGLTLDDFLADCGIPADAESLTGSRSFQCFPGEKSLTPLRCDCKVLTGKKDKTLGRLFVFTDSTLETDILTGFRSWESFRSFAAEHPEKFYRAAVAVCDITGLGAINNSLGRAEGDRLLQHLARLMPEFYPQGTYFIRGNDAALIAVTCDAGEGVMADASAKLSEAFTAGLEYGTAEAGTFDRNITAAIDSASRSMKNKKLLNEDSAHSSSVTSLIRALQECDPGTEAHVLRTQRSGAELGRRLGLSDMELSNLSLLCLLHDIGKIGIPLEILNKPGRLSDEEWTVIRKHPEKGFQIAMSSNEIRGISDMILHHHERWDGKGYPYGQKGASIPLLSRIIAVIDAYDAMTSDRPYRKAMPHEEAAEELRRNAGTQFDPYIVEQFLLMTDEGRRKDE